MAVIYDVNSSQCEHILVKTRKFFRKCTGCKTFKWPWSKAVGCIKCMKVWHKRCQPQMAEPTSITVLQNTGTQQTPCSNSVVVTTTHMGRFSYCHGRPLSLGKPTTVTWTFHDMGLEYSGHVFQAHLQLQHLLPAFGHPTNQIKFKITKPSEQATCTSAIADVAPSATAPLTTAVIATKSEITRTSQCRRQNCKSRRCQQRQLRAEKIIIDYNTNGKVENQQNPTNLHEFNDMEPSSNTADQWTSAIADIAPPLTPPLATAFVAVTQTNNTQTSQCRRINCKSRRCRQRQLRAELEQPYNSSG